MNQVATTQNQELSLAFDRTQVDLIKSMYFKGSSDDEFNMFMHVCKKTGLDPALRQIFPVKRYDSKLKREVMTVQTGIDGYRLIAERTGRYAPGREPTYQYGKDGQIISATSYVKKQTADGTWHEIAATAFFSEYCQKDREGKPTRFWLQMGHNQLAKCFDEQTEVLTEYGFRKFSDVKGKIMQVTENGLEPVDCKPFSQDYDGDMIAFHSQDLDFCVTPNHEMVTTSGIIEAGQMFDQARASNSYFIPRHVPKDNSEGLGLTQAQCELAAATLCDGDYMSSKKFRIKVSKPHKIEKIRSWNLHKSEKVRALAGKSSTHSSGRMITTKNDQIEFSFDMKDLQPLVIPYKRLNHEMMLKMNSQEAKWFVDAWTFFDGNANSGGGDGRTLRIWTSDLQYLGWLELLGVKAGYAISPTRSRISDIGTKPNFVISFSEYNEKGVSKHNRERDPSLVIEKNTSDKVWCVTVPSGKIVVKRLGYSMLCKNCAEALALRKAFPGDLSSIYTKEEMQQADVEIVNDPVQKIGPATISREQAEELSSIMAECEKSYQDRVFASLKSQKVETLDQLPSLLYDRLRNAALKKRDEYILSQEPLEQAASDA